MRLMTVIAALSLLAPAAALAQADTTQPPAAMAPAQGGPSAGGTAVIRPPGGVDPGINKAPPSTQGNKTFPMPVVAPPGSPGGDPNVVPK